MDNMYRERWEAGLCKVCKKNRAITYSKEQFCRECKSISCSFCGKKYFRIGSELIHKKCREDQKRGKKGSQPSEDPQLKGMVLVG